LTPEQALDSFSAASCGVLNPRKNKLLKLAKIGKLRLCTNPALLKELSNVLREDKFLPRIVILNTTVEELIAGLLELVEIFPDKIIPPTVKADPDDDKVLSCAQILGAKYIITGDHHLLNLKKWSGISILTPRQFLRHTK
jgi:uncharacterized protein